MSARSRASSPSWLMHLGDVRWVRGHISTFCLGAVLLVSADLLFGGSELWSLTAIGIWIMLLLVHILLVVIARLSMQLLADDDEEIVLLPIKEAVFNEPKADIPESWKEPSIARQDPAPETSPNETVSWTVATDMAQAKRNPNEDKPE